MVMYGMFTMFTPQINYMYVKLPYMDPLGLKQKAQFVLAVSP